jgi:hypothetical protein
LSDEEIHAIFSNVEIIFEYQKEFLKGIENSVLESPDGSQLGTVFAGLAPFLKTYTVYSSNYQNSINTLEKCFAKNAAFVKFLKECKEKPASRSLNISAYLIMPIQRIPRYVLLLEVGSQNR